MLTPELQPRAQAAYADEAGSQNRLALNGAFDFRSTLGLDNYPHTVRPYHACRDLPAQCTDVVPPPTQAVGFQLVDPIPLSSLATTSLATLALHHRRSLLAARDPARLAPLLDTLRTKGYSDILPPDSFATDLWIISNQTISERARTVNWGRLVGWGDRDGARAPDKGRFWMWSGRRGIDHVLSLNRVEGGWFVNGSIRRSRWASVERELARLEAESNAA